MHYNLLFNGCSFTFGSELQLIGGMDYLKSHRFSRLVAEHFKVTYDNIAISGSSNDLIVENTIKWFEEGNTCDIAVIQFSTKSRTIWYDENKKPHNILIKKDTRQSSNMRVLSKFYYKLFYSDELGNQNACKNLFLLENYFEQNDIKYILLELPGINIDFNCPWGKLCKNIKIKNILDLIGTQGNDGKTKDFNPHFCLPTKYGTGSHPSELGHEKIAQYIIDEIKLKKYNESIMKWFQTSSILNI